MFSQAKDKPSTQCQTSTNIQSHIDSSTEPTLNGDDPLFPDDDEDIFDNEEICKQLDEAKSSNNSKCRKSPQNITGIPKPKENAVKLKPIRSAPQTNESPSTINTKSIRPTTQTGESPLTMNAKSNENPEKRQRSLLDCLDDAYHKESPSKMKRESKSPIKRFSCSKPETIVSFLSNSMQVSKNNEIVDGNSSLESIDPESVDLNTENDNPPNDDDVNSESIKEMDDGLESLHVAQTSKENNIGSDNVTPATSPSTKADNANDKSQKSIFDYFKKS